MDEQQCMQGPESEERDSLLHYDDPIPISGSKLADYTSKLILEAFKDSARNDYKISNSSKIKTNEDNEKDTNNDRTGPILAGRIADSMKANIRNEKFLDIKTAIKTMLPPKLIVNNRSENEKWIQFPSTKPTSRKDVIELEKQLDEKLALKQATNGGVCPVRETHFSETFDELLRQIILDSPERGLMLMRVRDELRMTIAAYRTIYESGVCFSSRKASQSTDSLHQLENQVELLNNQVENLKIEKLECENRVQEMQKRVTKQRSERLAKQREEVANLKAQIKSFTEFLQQERK